MAGGFLLLVQRDLLQKLKRRKRDGRIQASGSIGYHRLGSSEPECTEYETRGSRCGHHWVRSRTHSRRRRLELADATPRQYPPRPDREIRTGEIARRVWHLQRHHDSPLRRQQQLVCRLRFLAIEILRPPKRETDQRRPQEMAGREAPPHDGSRTGDTDQLSRFRHRRLTPRLPRRRTRG